MSVRIGARSVVVGVAIALLVGACGQAPLESVGRRSSDWIGPVVQVALTSADADDPGSVTAGPG